MENVMHDIKIIEEDVENVEKKCEKVDCSAVYDVIIATIKLIYDLLFVVARRRIKNILLYYQLF